MRNIREIARLRLGLEHSERQTAESCGKSRSAVGECVKRLKRAGLTWPLPDDLDDAALEALLNGPTPAELSLRYTSAVASQAASMRIIAAAPAANPAMRGNTRQQRPQAS